MREKLGRTTDSLKEVPGLRCSTKGMNSYGNRANPSVDEYNNPVWHLMFIFPTLNGKYKVNSRQLLGARRMEVGMGRSWGTERLAPWKQPRL